MPANPPAPVADAVVNELPLRGPFSSTEIPPATPTETVSPVEESSLLPGPSRVDLLGSSPVPPSTPEQIRVEPIPSTRPFPETRQIEQTAQYTTLSPSEPTVINAAAPVSHKEHPQSTDRPRELNHALAKRETAPVAHIQVFKSPQRLVRSVAIEKWIPPVLLAAWRGIVSRSG